VNYMVNHLWQSTVFAAAVALTTMAMRRNSARLRYWLWLAASLKFLIPFSVLVIMGGAVARPTAEPVLPALTVVRVSTYFAPAPTFPTVAPAAAWSCRAFAMGAVWAAGALLLLFRWYRRWRAIRDATRNARPLQVHAWLPALSSRSTIEPRVFGLFRPILILPEGIADSLTPVQMQTILAHELCHVRYRDNLTAALHMCVETVFWFHPIVWWIGAKLVEERERACDENVLNRGGQPSDYAQGIVNVCKAYHEWPLPCASGITGSSLKRRIREIMTWHGTLHLTFGRKLMLAFAGIAAVAVPVGIGLVCAQTLPPAPAYTYEVVAIHKSSPGQPDSSIGPGTGGGLRAVNVTAIQLVTFAYKVRDYQIAGGPGWMTSDRFDVNFTPDKTEARPRPGAAPKEIEAFIGRNQQRMQAVLRDRFGLVLRAETHELPIYALVPAKGGMKLTLSANAARGPSLRGGPRGITGIGATIRQLAGHLSAVLGRPVIDETGSDDRQYDFKLEYTPEIPVQGASEEAPPPGDGPSIFTALTEQLGLRLESRKGPVPVYAIEKIEKPSEN
jgi:bla regulator protein BlaR1